MARILSIPDVHGTHQWEIVKTLTAGSCDYIVFHGDYFDSWENKWPDQGENFKNICNFVREDNEHRKLLLGNHDWSYISGTQAGSSTSGYQSRYALEIWDLLKQNLDIIDLAFECDGWVFSHAGFSSTWVNSMKKVLHKILDKWPDEDNDEDEDTQNLIWNEEEYSVDFLNQQWHKVTHSVEEGNFWYDFDELLDWYGFFSPSGDEKSQGPLWIRPESLLQDAYYSKQVVGHTELGIYDNVYLQQNNNRVICVDSSTHKVLEMIDTKGVYEYLTIQEHIDSLQKRHL